MPEEADPHQRTWMAFGASRSIWGRRLLPHVQQDLATLANRISEFEPVSMLVRPQELKIARALLSERVELVSTGLDDLWMRDSSAIFVKNNHGEKAAIDFNFNGWGNKQKHNQDKKVAAFVAKKTQVPLLNTSLVLEGGCIEVDGQGTAIITESCVLNSNRNPNMSKAEFEVLLKPLLGLDKIIWLPGIKGMDITDGHTDFYARFVRPGVVVAGYEPDKGSFDHDVTLQHLDILAEAKDAQGRSLEVIELEAPSYVRPRFDSEDFAAGYVGYYVCNGAVFMQQFGDEEADDRVESALQRAFPEREVIALNMDAIAAGGGSIHCATQQEPV